jgi:hypothetical protein
MYPYLYSLVYLQLRRNPPLWRNPPVRDILPIYS